METTPQSAPETPVSGPAPQRWQRPRRLHWLLLIAAAVLAADRISKILVSARVPFASSTPVIPRFLALSHWTNDGAAFSLFAGTSSPVAVRWGLVAFTSLAALAIFALLVRWGSRVSRATVALALVLGGALGNLHDRIAYGSVIDFIEVHIFSYHWPDFNIADSAVVIGACLLVLDSLLPPKSSQND